MTICNKQSQTNRQNFWQLLLLQYPLLTSTPRDMFHFSISEVFQIIASSSQTYNKTYTSLSWVSYIFSCACPSPPSRQNQSKIEPLSIRMVKYNLCPKRICCLFKTRNANYNLRKSDFVLPNFNTVTFRKHSLKYLCPKLLNRLPSKLRFATLCTNNFKAKIRKINLEILLDEGSRGCNLCNN